MKAVGFLAGVAAVSSFSAFLFAGEKEKQVAGIVVDRNGKPVANAEVAWIWSANGTQRDETGKVWSDWRKRWQNEGQMELRPGGVKTDARGKFSIADVAWRRTLLAIDKHRTRGGIALFEPEKKSLARITLTPLIHVHGQLTCKERSERLGWTGTYATVPEHKEQKTRREPLAFCGSMRAKFSFKLPPGKYILEACGTFLELGEDDIHTHTVRKTITLTADQREVDLGTINLQLDSIARAKFAGRWGNLADYYGKQPPKWNVSDARGLSKNVALADFKGKWVLIEFWGFG